MTVARWQYNAMLDTVASSRKKICPCVRHVKVGQLLPSLPIPSQTLSLPSHPPYFLSPVLTDDALRPRVRGREHAGASLSLRT